MDRPQSCDSPGRSSFEGRFAGIKDGDTVVTLGVQMLEAGLKVRPITARNIFTDVHQLSPVPVAFAEVSGS